MTDPESELAGIESCWTTRHRVALGFAGALVAGGVAALWLFVVPDKADSTVGLQSAAIRYGHPATWALLALLGLLVAANAPKHLRTAVGGMSLAAYAAFLIGMAL